MKNLLPCTLKYASPQQHSFLIQRQKQYYRWTHEHGYCPPNQQKSWLTLYTQSRLDELQQKFDDLESFGVFAKPEDMGVTVENLKFSFLIQKPNDRSQLFTFLGEVELFGKPWPALNSYVENTLGKLMYIIVSDFLLFFSSDTR